MWSNLYKCLLKYYNKQDLKVRFSETIQNSLITEFKPLKSHCNFHPILSSSTQVIPHKVRNSAFLESGKSTTFWKTKDPLQPELQTLVLLQCCQKRPRWQSYSFYNVHSQTLLSATAHQQLLVAPLQRCYNPLASGFLSPFLGLQPWHFTREYQVCDLSHRGVEMSAGLSLVAIKWVSYKIKRIFLSSTLSKQKISRTLLTLTYNLSSNKLLLHQIVQRGSITYRIQLFFFHFSRFAALWFPMRHESATLQVKIHSVKILLMFWWYFIIFTLNPLLSQRPQKSQPVYINMHDGEYFCMLETVFKHDSSMC